jgi:hypothetical protein
VEELVEELVEVVEVVKVVELVEELIIIDGVNISNINIKRKRKGNKYKTK